MQTPYIATKTGQEKQLPDAKRQASRLGEPYASQSKSIVFELTFVPTR
jgi:hypothetical protein